MHSSMPTEDSKSWFDVVLFPTVSTFFSLSSTGSMPSFAAILSIWVSTAKCIARSPKPRKLPPKTLLV